MSQRILVLVAASLVACSLARAEEPAARVPWDRETLALFESLPVQDGGRVKPVGTLAGFKLLKLNGKRSCTTPAGEDLTPVAWLLDTLLYPDLAIRYPVFLVQNSEVIDAIGLERGEKKKRDRYSYAELSPAFEKLRELATRHGQKEEKDRSAAEAQVVQLWSNVVEFDRLLHGLDFARESLPLDATDALKRIYSGARSHKLAAVMAHPKELVAAFHAAQRDNDDADAKAIQAVLEAAQNVATRSGALALFAPPGTAAEHPEWLAIPELLELRFTKEGRLDDQMRLVGLLEEMNEARDDRATFKAKLGAFRDGASALARARGEYAKVSLEVAFYKGDFFYRALLLYILAFALLAISWLAPRKILDRASLVSVAVATLLVVTGIIFRCIIRGRPPVSTLYETIIFTTAVAVIACLVIEYLNRERVASALATVIGVAGMFLAGKYEFRESVTSGDTMPSLIAVLDTNFWLSTHVTTVTMGYSAGLLASAIAHVWLVGKMLGLRANDEAFYKNISRTTYGVLCFGLLFSTLGTLLGGIWANESWGRFWGWDPKENGALMICLWELAILHARLGGYVRDFGLAITSVLGGCVVAFSWWGVNLLGVGLHSYGFTSGVFEVLVALYVVEGLIVLLALGWRLGHEKPAPVAAAPAALAAAPDGPAS